MNVQLARAMIQRQHKGVTPPRTITAPMPKLGTDHTTEADRLATFDQSARTIGGKVAPFVAPAARVPDPQSPLAAGAASSYAAEQSPVDDEEMYEAYLFKYGLD